MLSTCLKDGNIIQFSPEKHKSLWIFFISLTIRLPFPFIRHISASGIDSEYAVQIAFILFA